MAPYSSAGKLLGTVTGGTTGFDRVQIILQSVIGVIINRIKM